jgi:hypothetical protein
MTAELCRGRTPTSMRLRAAWGFLLHALEPSSFHHLKHANHLFSDAYAPVGGPRRRQLTSYPSAQSGHAIRSFKKTVTPAALTVTTPNHAEHHTAPYLVCHWSAPVSLGGSLRWRFGIARMCGWRTVRLSRSRKLGNSTVLRGQIRQLIQTA